MTETTHPVRATLGVDWPGGDRRCTVEIHRDTWDGMTPREREEHLEALARSHAAEYVEWDWTLDNPADDIGLQCTVPTADAGPPERDPLAGRITELAGQGMSLADATRQAQNEAIQAMATAWDAVRAAPPGPYATVAHALRDIADRLDTVTGDDLLPLWATLHIQPHRPQPHHDAPVVRTVDTIATALLGRAGEPEELSPGYWHHGASDDDLAGVVLVSVYGRVLSPQQLEIDRITAERDALRIELAARSGGVG